MIVAGVLVSGDEIDLEGFLGSYGVHRLTRGVNPRMVRVSRVSEVEEG